MLSTPCSNWLRQKQQQATAKLNLLIVKIEKNVFLHSPCLIAFYKVPTITYMELSKQFFYIPR